MNSAQRRQLKRAFPYAVRMVPKESDRYFHHDHRVSVARTWCRRQFGAGNFRSTEDWDSAEFKFAREKDAAYFALRWS